MAFSLSIQQAEYPRQQHLCPPGLKKLLADLDGTGSLRRFSLLEYYRLAELGVLHPDERVELLDGIVVKAATSTPQHASVVTKLSEMLLLHLHDSKDVQVRVRSPITLEECTSEPVPDLAVVVVASHAYWERHPQAAEVLLVVEVADESLELDQQQKAAVYACARMSEYWVLNLVDRWLEIYREPYTSASGRTDFGTKRTFLPDHIVTPLALPTCHIHLAQVFPN